MPTLNEIEHALTTAEQHVPVVSVRDSLVELWLIIRALYRFEKSFPGIEPIAELRKRTYDLFDQALAHYNVKVQQRGDMIQVTHYGLTYAIVPDRYTAYRYVLDIILED